MAKQSYLNQLQWGLVLSEAWSNNEFRQRLELDPTGTIKTYARDRLGVDLEHAFQMPLPPGDLGVEALRNSSRSGSYAAGAACASGSGTAPACASGSGTAANTSSGQVAAPACASGSGTAPACASGSGTAPACASGSGTSGPGGSSHS